MDPHRQRLDAEPRGRGLQPRDHAHGSDRLRRRADQPGGAGQVRAHRVGRLCVRRGVRARRVGVVPAQGPPHRTGQALDDRGRVVRPGRRAVGGGARRRERLPLGRTPEDEAGRHRRHVGDAARARRLHRDRLPRPEGARDALRDPHPGGDGPHRHALAQHRDARHRRAREARRGSHPRGPEGLRRAAEDPRGRRRRQGHAGRARRLRGQRHQHGLRAAAQALCGRPAPGH
ncbi:hypothetical protein D3C72_1635220 [compost metagenome]